MVKLLLVCLAVNIGVFFVEANPASDAIPAGATNIGGIQNKPNVGSGSNSIPFDQVRNTFCSRSSTFALLFW